MFVFMFALVVFSFFKVDKLSCFALKRSPDNSLRLQEFLKRFDGGKYIVFDALNVVNITKYYTLHPFSDRLILFA